MIEGGGQPDRGTRRMVKRLNEELGLPVFICCDADPYGWHISSVYTFGSMSLAYTFEKLACPKAKFLGISASDIYKYQIPKEGLLKAEKADLKRAEDMLKYPWFKNKFWQKELKLFLQKQQKSEIEALSRHSYKFLAETYLPEKLGEHDISSTQR
jgi:DNA topoisomerase-6 subunit A